MTDLAKAYRYQYRLTQRFGNWEHNYELVGCYGGVHLHISEHNKEMATALEMPFSGGIEFHYRTPPKGDEKPPDHDECWLIKANCWHDGSSLWAERFWIPLFERARGDHGLIFEELAKAASEKFTEHVNG